MNIVLSFDFEVFFGRQTGTIECTLLEPSRALCEMAKRHNVVLVFFVDIGFLLRLREEGRCFPALMRDYDLVMLQLERFVTAGHEIQLHVHPHWEDSHWNGEFWDIDTHRYRLHDFSELEIREIVNRYADGLRNLAGESVCAYRAGGWMIQPFAQISKALLDANICIDSTIFAGGTSEGDIHEYDFSSAPLTSHWFFENDPLLINPNGPFLEVPIASYPVSPAFYWRFAIAKKLGGARHRAFGDGSPIPMSSFELLRKLSRWTNSVVSMDGYKISFLEDAYNQYEQIGMADFVVIGHTKALTRFSLQKLDSFIGMRDSNQFVGYGAYRNLLVGRELHRN